MSKMIVLIDDDCDDQVIFTDTVKDIAPDIECVTAATGKEAIKKLSNISPAPSAIFLDLNMPGMDGFDFLRLIKTNVHLKNIPVLILSTSNNPDDKKKAFSLGAVEYLTKVGNYKVLKSKITSAIDKIFSLPLLLNN